jgi:hypothetical protein
VESPPRQAMKPRKVTLSSPFFLVDPHFRSPAPCPGGMTILQRHKATKQTCWVPLPHQSTTITSHNFIYLYFGLMTFLQSCLFFTDLQNEFRQFLCVFDSSFLKTLVPQSCDPFERLKEDIITLNSYRLQGQSHI